MSWTRPLVSSGRREEYEAVVLASPAISKVVAGAIFAALLAIETIRFIRPERPGVLQAQQARALGAADDRPRLVPVPGFASKRSTEDVERLLKSSRNLSATDRVILSELQSIKRRLDETRPEG